MFFYLIIFIAFYILNGCAFIDHETNFDQFTFYRMINIRSEETFLYQKTNESYKWDLSYQHGDSLVKVRRLRIDTIRPEINYDYPRPVRVKDIIIGFDKQFSQMIVLFPNTQEMLSYSIMIQKGVFSYDNSVCTGRHKRFEESFQMVISGDTLQFDRRGRTYVFSSEFIRVYPKPEYKAYSIIPQCKESPFAL